MLVLIIHGQNIFDLSFLDSYNSENVSHSSREFERLGQKGVRIGDEVSEAEEADESGERVTGEDIILQEGEQAVRGFQQLLVIPSDRLC